MRIKLIIFTILLLVVSCGRKSQQRTPVTTNEPELATQTHSDTVKIRMLGDIMMHAKQIELACRKDSTYDFSSYFSIIKDSLRQADICIANLEFPLAGEPYTGYPTFSAPDCIVEYLDSCGIDVLLCANNHIYDKGSQGAARTIKTIHTLAPSIKICGLASDSTHLKQTTPLILDAKGMKISLVNFTYGTNIGADKYWPKTNYMSNKALISDALAKAAETDLTIALPHWGDEYTFTPSESQRNTAIWLAEKGADVIIGTHPHVPQPLDTLTEKKIPVAYSLGNAVSNMSAANTQMELMATIRVVKHGDGRIELLPIYFTYLWCSRPGGFGESYTVIPVMHFIDKKDKWAGAWDYDKMITTYKRVKDSIKIEDR